MKSKRFIITLALLCVLVAIWTYISVISQDKFKEKAEPQVEELEQPNVIVGEENPFATSEEEATIEEPVLEEEEVKEEVITEPVQVVEEKKAEADSKQSNPSKATTKPKVAEKNYTPLDKFFIKYEEEINGLAIGFTMMTTILDKPSDIQDVSQIKNEMLFAEAQYRDIFDTLRKSETKEANSLISDYEQLLNSRMKQADSLQLVNDVATVKDKDASTKASTLWKKIVSIHKEYGERTGVDFTGGLGDLMK